MADQKLATSSLWLCNHWGGPQRVGWVPKGGFAVADAAAKHPLGTVVSVFNHKSQTGWSDLVYVYIETEDVTNVAVKNMFVVHYGTTPVFGYMTNDAGGDLAAVQMGGMLLATIDATAAAKYTWIWCGGVVPKDYFIDGGYVGTDNSVDAGPVIFGDLGTGGTTYGEIGLTNFLETSVEKPIGWALAADENQ